MESLQQSINSFFLIVFYIPFNIVVMILVLFSFKFINTFYELNFPNWIIAISSAVLVFVFLYVLVDSTSRTKGMVTGNFENVLSTTIIINIFLAILMILIIMFTKVIFKR